MALRTRAELAYFIANAPRRILRAQQIVYLERGAGGGLAARAVSSVRQVDRSSPLILWLESSIEGLEREVGLLEPRQFDAGAFPEGFEAVAASYPLRYVLWVPMLDRAGRVIAGQLLARTIPWTRPELAVASHLAASFSQAWRGMGNPGWSLPGSGRATRRALAVAAVAAAALLAVPVPMSALAPVEVAPRDAVVVTSGVEGVVKAVLVEPGQPVRQGQPLLRIADTTLKSRFEIAAQEVVVAETRYKKAAQQAFIDAKGRHELGLAQAELGLKMSERDYAQELLARTEITADRDGIAFFGDRKDLIGRPIAVGEKLMEIADPQSMEFRIDLAVSDAIVLREAARVKIFLDSDPLNPIETHLVRTGYQARARENQQLAFRLVAEAAPGLSPAARLGVRGTAQVFSATAPLGLYLFRRPITVARQWLGL